MPTDKLYQQVFYFCSPVGGGGGGVEKLRLKLTSAKVKLKLRLSFAIGIFDLSNLMPFLGHF